MCIMVQRILFFLNLQCKMMSELHQILIFESTFFVTENVSSL